MSGDVTDETLLILSSGVPLYSARGLTMTLTPITEAGNLRRSINGNLLDLTYEQFRKYALKISCVDQRAPAIDGVFKGMTVDVAVPLELPYLTSGTPGRTPVSGTERTEGDFTFYRPMLSMMVDNYSVQFDEYGAAVSWQLDLLEV